MSKKKDIDWALKNLESTKKLFKEPFYKSPKFLVPLTLCLLILHSIIIFFLKAIIIFLMLLLFVILVGLW